MRFEIDKGSYLEAMETRWNTKAFGFKVFEIKNIVHSEIAHAYALLGQYVEFEKLNNIGCSLIRIDASDFYLKKALIDCGFYCAETSIDIEIKNIHKMNIEGKFKSDLIIEPPNDDDYHTIKKIAENDFYYGRFHEDINFEIDKVRAKYSSWIDDMKDGQEQFLVYKREGKVISFLAYKIIDDIVDLILAGSAKGNGAVSYYFWASFMRYFKEIGFKKFFTNISATNIGILNLYMALGFKFTQTKLGFHKYNVRR